MPSSPGPSVSMQDKTPQVLDRCCLKRKYFLLEQKILDPVCDVAVCFILFRKTNLSWALYSLGVMEFISVPAIHRLCLQKVRCSWGGVFLVVFSCFGGFCFVFKHEREVLGFPFWWAIILSFQFAFTNLLCLILCLVLLCPTSSWKSWSWKGNSCWALGAEALQTWEVGGGFFPIGHVQNLHRLALLNRRDAGCFLPFLSLLNMRLERLAIPEVLWVPSSGGEGKYSSQSLLLELMYSSFLPF